MALPEFCEIYTQTKYLYKVICIYDMYLYRSYNIRMSCLEWPTAFCSVMRALNIRKSRNEFNKDSLLRTIEPINDS